MKREIRIGKLALGENPELARVVATCVYDLRDLSDENWVWTKETGFVSAEQIEGLSLDES